MFEPDLLRPMSPVDSGNRPPPFGLEPTPSGFPLFSEAPFVVWYHQHRKLRRQGHIHPTCQPPIRLWDEADEPSSQS